MAETINKAHAQIVCGLAAAAALLVGLFLLPGLGDGLERSIFDLSQRLSDGKPHRDVAIVAIDANSKSHLGEWPWPNSLHAQLIEQLHAAGSKTVVFTTPLDETRGGSSVDRVRAAMAILQSPDIAKSGRVEELRNLLSGSVEDSDDDKRLRRAIESHGQVLLPVDMTFETSPATASATALNLRNWPESDTAPLGEALSARILSEPSSILAAARGGGHLASPADSDGVMRRELAAVKVGERLLPALSVAAAASFKSAAVRFASNTLILADQGDIPLEKHLGLMVRNPPPGGQTTLPSYSYWEVLAGKVDATKFAGKAVIVGITDGSNADRITTSTGHAVPRALVLGGAVQSLIDGDFYRHSGLAVFLQFVVYLGVVALAALAVASLSLVAAAVVTATAIAVLLGLELGMLATTGLWLQLGLACVAAVLAFAARTLLSTSWKAQGERPSRATSSDGLRTLALTLQGQGQLDLAYETFRRCPADATTLDLLYRLGNDFERRRQLGKAADVYAHISKIDAHFRDVREKYARLSEQNSPVSATVAAPATPPPTRAAVNPPPPRPATINRPAPAAKEKPQAPAKETLGRYEIERQIGKGAMGVVYVGRDPKINRVVAIKAIPLAEEFADTDLAEARERFFREAEMAGRLNHPGIVTVFDAGEDRGLAYIAMELLRGEHLSFYAEPQNLLPVRKVMQLVARLADALDYAHRQNVIHRDIKPANIMFNVETDMLKITDFGIARLTDVSRTKTGIVLGTPSFMSPEQLEGRPIDGRSDLFALGVTLYQLLSAQLPFRADSMTRLMNKIATEPHTPIRSIRPELPEAVDGILERALAKTSDSRYHTGAEMAEALRTALRSIES